MQYFWFVLKMLFILCRMLNFSKERGNICLVRDIFSQILIVRDIFSQILNLWIHNFSFTENVYLALKEKKKIYVKKKDSQFMKTCHEHVSICKVCKQVNLSTVQSWFSDNLQFSGKKMPNWIYSPVWSAPW